MARKSFKEELKLFHRYSELTEPYFKVLNEHLKSKDPMAKRWAVEQLSKAFVKMLPQDIDLTTKGESLNPLSAEEKAKLLALLDESQSS
jgi:hypothetical protein